MLKYKCLNLIGLHKSSIPSTEFVKLVMLIVLAQFIARFNISSIEQFVMIDNLYKKEGNHKRNIERESSLVKFKLFDELKFDDLLQEIYSRIEPLYFSKDLQSLTKVKLQEVIISSVKAKQILFHYSFSYVFL